MLVSNALKKMRANHMDAVAKFRPTFLWRGMRDMAVEENFLLQGGTELACMSSSASLAVVGAYAASCTPLLFRIKVDSPMELLHGHPAFFVPHLGAKLSTHSLGEPRVQFADFPA